MIKIKKLIATCLIMLALAVLSNIASAAPATNDLWDVNQGAATVTDSSPIKIGEQGVSDARNMFGTNFGGIEPGAGTTVFGDFQPAGTEHWVQWQTTAVVALGSFKLYAAHDLGTNGRSFDYFSLFAKDLGTGVFTQIYGADIAVPYVFIGGEELFVAQHTFAAPIIAQDFKAIFRQYGYVEWASGPRIYELDGFAVPEPATISLLGLGVLAFFRKRKT